MTMQLNLTLDKSVKSDFLTAAIASLRKDFFFVLVARWRHYQFTSRNLGFPCISPD